MKLSSRITELTGSGSDGWELFIKAREMIAEGQQITELTIGEHDIRTHPDILEAMRASAAAGRTGYMLVPGSQSLRETVAARVQERTGVPTTPDNVLITQGGQSALFATHAAVCDPGDTALYCAPYYATYPGTIRGVSAIPEVIQTRPENLFQPQLAEIEAVASGATSLLVNSPNNPTGVVYSRETLDGIATACLRHDLWLISDEVYDTQVWDDAHISPRSLPDMAERTLVIGSMSKSHAMTGSRIGWIVGPEPAIDRLISLALHTNFGVAGFIQDAAEYALKRGPDLEQLISAPFPRRRDIARRILSTQNLLQPVPSGGTMYLMLDIRATGLTGNAFANALLESKNIAVMPGESYGLAAAGHIRIAMTVEDKEFETAMIQLVEFAKGLSV
ncbi:MAG: pyridoxal phosphate-dependent aminotransferase [Marinosulfonomonas sp.]|nr:pyridoxal phosphate-dependent aminotransferase [Marinosulfonomonas sp.]